MRPGSVAVYVDLKSPYAYLAKDLVYALEDETGTRIDWLPYTLDIPSYAGSAELDERGTLLSEQRNPHQWRRIRYSYMDCRREASRRGLVLRGPRKIYDSTPANIGMLFAKRCGVLRGYLDAAFEHFFQRELDLEDVAAIEGVLREAGADVASWRQFESGEGRRELLEIQRAAEAAGVFGVPSFLFADGDLYWGREHLPRVRERLGK